MNFIHTGKMVLTGHAILANISVLPHSCKVRSFSSEVSSYQPMSRDIIYYSDFRFNLDVSVHTFRALNSLSNGSINFNNSNIVAGLLYS
jgi:hypothetical protein